MSLVTTSEEVARMFMARYVRHALEETEFIPKRLDASAAFARFNKA
jgi:hypothetical protein